MPFVAEVVEIAAADAVLVVVETVLAVALKVAVLIGVVDFADDIADDSWLLAVVGVEEDTKVSMLVVPQGPVHGAHTPTEIKCG